MNKFINSIFNHFSMLCFSENELPLYLKLYKYILYSIFYLFDKIIDILNFSKKILNKFK